MFFSTLATLSLLATSVAATPTPVLQARASSSATIYMRIEGPTKTVYEQTIVASAQSSLTVGGHTASTCDGTPNSAAGVTSLVALQETGQYFEANWNGATFGRPTKINGTSNSGYKRWGTLVNNLGNNATGGIYMQGGDGNEYDEFCYQALPDKQHMLYAYMSSDMEATSFLILSGPKTAKVGDTVQYQVPHALDGTYVNDLSQDGASGQKVYAQFGSNSGSDATVSIKFTEAGTYNMKAHCPSGTACVRSNHVVTVVS